MKGERGGRNEPSLVEPHSRNHLSCGDERPPRNGELLDRARARRANRELHLHALEHDDLVARFHMSPLIGHNLLHRARDLRAHRLAPRRHVIVGECGLGRLIRHEHVEPLLDPAIVLGLE